MNVKPIKPLKRAPLLHVSVQESLRAYIEDNRLDPGAPLPPEGELAHQLGVSRNSVREGIKALESVGVLESRRGIGVFVKAFSFEPLLENLAYGLGSTLKQIEEVITIRRTLEVGLIDRTLELISADDIRELRETCDKMKERAARGESFPNEDRNFHQLLFRCQGNQVLLRLIEVFWLAFYKASDFVNLDNADPMQTWRDHAAIVDAVEARDLAAAKDRLDKHYTGINRVIAYNKTSTPVETTSPVGRTI
ncbi:MAG TPA: FadR/GntR family transcriptional regulator [Mycoplana sp.]|jgi:DNA-binding FadR family transcriptional regulator|nr:FadR/GntR family transcriptional regulator [Mycoplana sp.]